MTCSTWCRNSSSSSADRPRAKRVQTFVVRVSEHRFARSDTGLIKASLTPSLIHWLARRTCYHHRRRALASVLSRASGARGMSDERSEERIGWGGVWPRSAVRFPRIALAERYCVSNFGRKPWTNHARVALAERHCVSNPSARERRAHRGVRWTGPELNVSGFRVSRFLTPCLPFSRRLCAVPSRKKSVRTG